MFDVNDHDDLDRRTFAEYVPISSLFVDLYQRPVKEGRINRTLREGFDADKLGCIMLSLREDGRYAILDGNHRVQMARKVGITALFARIFINLSYEQEAAYFRAFNTVNLPTAMDRFRARVEEREPEALEMVAILEQHGMRVAFHGEAVGAVGAVAALDRLYIDLGPQGYYDVVNLIHRAWGNERRAWIGPMIDGVRQFWIRYREEADIARLEDRLKLVHPEDILRNASVGLVKRGSAGSRIGRQIAEAYNQGLRNRRLSDWVDHPGKRFSQGGHRPSGD